MSPGQKCDDGRCRRQDLLRITLNQAVAVAMVDVPRAGLDLLAVLDDDKSLADNHRLAAVRGAPHDQPARTTLPGRPGRPPGPGHPGGITMESTKADALKVPGATLYYEVQGSGPSLLLICGGIYDARTYAGLAQQLADRYTVLTYDRRGNSRSPLDGAPEQQSIAVHADDAYRLLTTVAGDEPAYVFGNSSGAIFGLELAARHPAQVRAIVAHEPPIFELLPDRDHWREVIKAAEDTFAKEGAGPAMQVFNAGFGGEQEEGGTQAEGGAQAEDGATDQEPQADLDPETAAHLAEIGLAMEKNMEFFIGYEVPPVARYIPDFTALQASPARVVAAVGDASEGTPMSGATLALAERLGTEPVVFPGDHGGFAVQPEAFAAKLHEVLARL